MNRKLEVKKMRRSYSQQISQSLKIKYSFIQTFIFNENFKFFNRFYEFNLSKQKPRICTICNVCSE